MCKITPVIEQYLKIKALHNDKLLFFRLGDFYELYFDDAKIVSELLSIVLTNRGKFKGKPIPMSGVPYHSVNNYLLKLIKLGKKIAICEQIGTTRKNGLIERKVVKILTKGTVVEDGYLDEYENNFICTLFDFNDNYGLAALDISTGYFFIMMIKGDFDLFNELDRLKPSEIIISERFKKHFIFSTDILIQRVKYEDFNYEKSLDILKKCFRYKNIDLLKKSKFRLSVIAAGYLLNFISFARQSNLSNITELYINNNKDFLYITSNSRRDLEIFNSISGDKRDTLLYSIDYTITSMGKRLLKQWLGRPILSRYNLRKRLTAVTKLKRDQSYLKLEKYFKGMYDVERIISKIVYHTVTPIDLKRLQISLEKALKLKNELYFIGLTGILIDIYLNINSFLKLINLISKSIDIPSSDSKSGYIIKPGYDLCVDNYRKLYENTSKYVIEFELEERENTDISNLRVKYNHIDGYFIEITKSNFLKVPDYYKKIKSLKNINRYISVKLTYLEKSIKNIYNNLVNREKKIYNNIIFNVKNNIFLLQKTFKYISMLDVIQSFSKKSSLYKWCEPTLINKSILNIKGGRHTIIERDKLKTVISNDLYMDSSNRTMIITGPNMGGKSTYMRQAAIIILLSHIGCHVPAEYSEIGFFDKIFTRIGFGDDLVNACSTFMLEMKEIAIILKYATKNSFVIIDEIGRGTGIISGFSLAWSIVIYLSKYNKSFSLISTHFYKLSDLSNMYSFVFCIHFMAIINLDKLLFLYKFKKGSSNKSFGLEVADLSGLPEEVIKIARIKFNEYKIDDIFSKSDLEIDRKKYLNLVEIISNIDASKLSYKEAIHNLDILKKIVDNE